MLPPQSARCIRTASALYEGILDEIEANDYDVFNRRAVVSPMRKLVLVARSVARH